MGSYVSGETIVMDGGSSALARVGRVEVADQRLRRQFSPRLLDQVHERSVLDALQVDEHHRIVAVVVREVEGLGVGAEEHLPQIEIAAQCESALRFATKTRDQLAADLSAGVP